MRRRDCRHQWGAYADQTRPRPELEEARRVARGGGTCQRRRSSPTGRGTAHRTTSAQCPRTTGIPPSHRVRYRRECGATERCRAPCCRRRVSAGGRRTIRQQIWRVSQRSLRLRSCRRGGRRLSRGGALCPPGRPAHLRSLGRRRSPTPKSRPGALTSELDFRRCAEVAVLGTLRGRTSSGKCTRQRSSAPTRTAKCPTTRRGRP